HITSHSLQVPQCGKQTMSAGKISPNGAVEKRRSAAGDESVRKWREWRDNANEQDIIALEYNGSLKRKGLVKAVGVSRSVFTQNPTIRAELEEFEKVLREDGVLPDETEETKAKKAAPKRYDPSKRQRQY